MSLPRTLCTSRESSEREEETLQKEKTLQIFTLKRPAATLAFPVLAVASLFLVTACGGGTATEEPSGGGTTRGSTTTLAPSPTTGETTAASEADAISTSTSTDSGLFFPEHEAGPVPSSVGRGKLMVDQAGCIRLETGAYDTAATIIWPPDYALETEGGEILILDKEGQVVTQVGDQLTIGGGGIGDSLEGVSGVDERTRRELHERCPGSYFYAGEVVSAQ